MDPMLMDPMKTPIYMDYHATTPVDPQVLEAMLPYFTETFGNAASRSHVFGWTAEEAVNEARASIAKLIGAKKPKEIVFTSGATESNNLALKGVAHFYRKKGNHIITTVIEHKAVLDTCKRLEKDGFEITYLPVDTSGLVDPAAVEAAIKDSTILVSVMLANNEIGTIQPIKEIGAITRKRGVLLHTDAVQGIGKTPFDVEAFNVDLASLTAHKIYGPKGIGALYVRRTRPRVRLQAEIDGGGHEFGMRSGTLNVPSIVGFGKACAILADGWKDEAKRLRTLRNRLLDKLKAGLDQVTVNGSFEHRLPNNLNISFGFVEGESLIMALKEIAVSSGSACTSASLEPSYVLHAMGISDDMAHSSLRFGLGRFTTEEEVDYVAGRVIEAVKRLRDMSPLWEMHQEGIDLSTVTWAAH
jgi:cysteine desulfurase